MEILTDAAAWMGAGSLVALTGWAVGRWHGLPGKPGVVPEQVGTKAWTPLSTAADPAFITMPQDGQADTDAADQRLSLSQLHDDITALRHREQILTTFASNALTMDRIVIDQPQSAADMADRRQEMRPQPDSLSPKLAPSNHRQNAAHPSPGASFFTRV